MEMNQPSHMTSCEDIYLIDNIIIRDDTDQILKIVPTLGTVGGIQLKKHEIRHLNNSGYK